MKKINLTLVLLFLFFGLSNFAQQGPPARAKIKVTGKIVDKTTNQPLEYATITLKNIKNPKGLTGGITNSKGEFEAEVFPGVYDITAEFISFKSNSIKGKEILEKTALGTIALEEDASQLNEVVVRSEKTTVEIKLDKKVYSVGKDLMVKGGTVSDVLDNIPSVAVSTDGVISLRGNENIRFLVDGRPSNAINITEALRQIPADAIDKVEVITNPSARYDAEGGAGILNIILKKGKNKGLNGSLIANAGDPETYGASANINYKTEKLNFFTTTGYNYRNNTGYNLTETQYLNKDETTKGYVYDNRDTERIGKGTNSNIGMEWTIAPNTYWTNTFNYRTNKGDNTDDVLYDYYDANKTYLNSSTRDNTETADSKNIEYATNFTKNFKKDGHKLTIDGSYSKNDDDAKSIIIDNNIQNSINPAIDKTATIQDQSKYQIQTDYVLPFGKGSQFEAGYKGEFTNLTNDYVVAKTDGNGTPIPSPNLSNILEYKEYINAFYTQYGFKKNKFSYLFGLRWENSNIEVNQLTSLDFNTKKYNNFFPSAFVTYDLTDDTSLTLSYSKRISRPRGRFMNPFPNYASNINIFQGNPDLDPSMTDKFDFGFLKRWDKLTFSTSMYYENTTDVFTFVRLETGDLVNGTTPVILSTPINLAKEERLGFELTLNYSPYKWWKLNGSFNLYNVITTGDYTYTDFQGQEVYQNFDSKAFSSSSRINSRITLPYKIEWQVNANYNGPQTTAQGKILGMFGANTALSKDLMKDKATLALNVNDIFNSRIRKMETHIDGSINSYGEMQMRARQIMLSFTYRFNKAKNEKERPKKPQGEGEGEFQG
jgi:outer membrane receptor for ferrienterochelin and colicins